MPFIPTPEVVADQIIKSAFSSCFLFCFPSREDFGTYARGFEGGVSVDDGFDCQFGFLAVERDRDVGYLERVRGNVACRIGRFDGLVDLLNLARLQRGGGIAHLDEQKYALVLVLAPPPLTDNNAVSDKVKLFHNAVHFA